MVGTRPITSIGGRGWTVGGRTHSERRAAAAARTGPSGTWCPAVKPAHVWSGVEAGRTEAGERPASFVCRDVACVYRTEAVTRAAARRRDPELREERAPTGPDDGSAAGFKRRQVQLEGSRATYNHGWQPRRGDRALGKEDRTGFTGTSLLIIEGGVSWDYPSGSPLSRPNQTGQPLLWGRRCGCGVAAWLTQWACMLLERSVPDPSHLAGLGYTTCQLAPTPHPPPSAAGLGAPAFLQPARPTGLDDRTFQARESRAGSGDKRQDTVHLCRPNEYQCLGDVQG